MQNGNERGQGSGGGRIHFEYLDGVRGMAALFVMAHHLWRDYTKTALTGLKGLATNWLLYGHLAVDVFIVLSGFCLMLPVARSGSLRGGWRRFYKGRARRILPPLYGAIGVAILVLALHHQVPRPRAILANVLLVQDIFQSQNTIDGPLWSVAVECKIYLLFPIFIWLWTRFGPLAVVLTSGVLSAVLYWAVGQIPPVTNPGHICPWYLLLFAMGMMAADLTLRRETHLWKWLPGCLFFATLAGLAACLWAWPVTPAGENPLFTPHLPVIDAATGLLAALVLAILGKKTMREDHSPVIQWISWKPFVFLGTIAYSVYLIHAVLIYKLRNMLDAHLAFHPPLLVIPIDMAIIVGVAYLFHLAIERPFMSKHAPRSEHEAEIAAALNPAP